MFKRITISGYTCQDSHLISHTNPSGHTTIIPKPELLEVAYSMLGKKQKSSEMAVKNDDLQW